MTTPTKFTRTREGWALTVVQNGAAECDFILMRESAPGRWDQHTVDRFAPASRAERERFSATVEADARPIVDALLREAATLNTQRVPNAPDGSPRELAEGTAPGVAFLDDEAVEQLPPVEWQVRDHVVKNGLTVAFGPPGCGKSFYALGLAASVGTGRDLYGGAVRRGAVVYVAAEGSAGLGVRLRAWKQHAMWPGRIGIQFRLSPVQLLEPGSVRQFIADVLALDERPVLVVFDTLHRCLAGGDENSSTDMGRAIQALDAIRAETGAAALVLHHTNVGGERERGSTSLRGAVDTMIALRGENGAVRLVCEKQKDAAEFAPIDLRLDPFGNSAVLVAPNNPWEREDFTLTRQHSQLLESLSRDFLPEGATAAKWQTASKVAESSFYRARTDLVIWGYVAKEDKTRGALYSLTDTGRNIVAPSSQVTPNSLPESDSYSLPPLPPLLEVGEGGSEEQEEFVMEDRAA